MAIACPACGKKSDGAPECPRCGCDLATLEMIIRASEQELALGRRSFLDGDFRLAMHHSGKSWYLRKNPEAARLAFLSALSLNDLANLGRWYARAKSHAGHFVQ
jgi:hypothetical protein